MNQEDLAFTPALEQARLIRDRQLSPLELVEIFLKRATPGDPRDEINICEAIFEVVYEKST